MCFKRVVQRLRALIVLPTRDLAVQVKAVFDKFTPTDSKVKVGILIGQSSFAGEQAMIAEGLDVIVCTPGRLMDHIEMTKELDLQVQSLSLSILFS